MYVKVIEILLVLAIASGSLGLDLQQLSDDCLAGNALKESQDLQCTTQKGVRIQSSRRSGQTFFCAYYEKKTGNKNEFEILSFDLPLNDDYDLKFTGANVFNNDSANPKFKVFDLRTRRTYKGKFAFASGNSAFDVKNIYLNDEKQICVDGRNVQKWPQSLPQSDDYDDVATTRKSEATTRSTTETYRTTTTKKAVFSTTSTTSSGSCGEIKKTEMYSEVLAASPGQFPWVVAIYRYVDGDHDSYKCAGTIIDKRKIVTSVNCLLEDGLLLKSSDLRVYVSPSSLPARIQNSKKFAIAEIVPHEGFNNQLENNIAVVRLARDIEFDDYVQPICLPRQTYTPKGKIGKLAGFGKSSMACEPMLQHLTSAEYVIGSNDLQTFAAENTSGNSKVSDLGSGLFVNETNQWTLAGIVSKRSSVGSSPQKIDFTNVARFFNWIDNFRDKPTFSY